MVSGAHKTPSLRHPDAKHEPGRIAFARRSELGTKVGESASGKVARIHDDLVVLPFIESIQQGNGHLAGTKHEAKDAVPLHRDGCGPAPEEDRRPDKLDENARRCIIHIKGNPAATAVQQVCLPACVPPDAVPQNLETGWTTRVLHIQKSLGVRTKVREIFKTCQISLSSASVTLHCARCCSARTARL